MWYFYAIILTLLPASSAWASRHCLRDAEHRLEAQRSLPPLIPRSAAQGYTFELEKAGKFVTTPGELAGLPDGHYVYLIDDEGRVIYSIETPHLGEAYANGQHFASHRSLEAQYKETLGVAPQVRAAGEFHVINGRVPEVNNRARTFPAGQANLDYAASHLAEEGLKVEGGTIRKDYAVEPEVVDRHIKNRERSEWAARAGNTPEYGELTTLYRELAERYPDSKVPGFMDVEMIKARLRTERTEAFKRMRSSGQSNDQIHDHMALLDARAFIIEKLQLDGPELIIKNYRDPAPTPREELGVVIQALRSALLP